MKTTHRLLTTYTILVVVFAILFTFVMKTTNPTSADIYSMIFSIAMFSLIPIGIILLIRRHR